MPEPRASSPTPMTDENDKAVSPPVPSEAAEPVPPTEPAPPETIMGVPLAVYVRGGGTTSAGHDRMIHEIEDDAEHRRNVQDAQRRVASVPIEQGGARMYSRQTGSPQETPKVLLRYLTPGGEPWVVAGDPVECLADIIVGANAEDPDDLILQIVCPRCKAKGVPHGQCQLTIRQSNRRWHLDTGTAGELIVYDGQPYSSAGRVMESERFRCPDCAWSARIDDNKVYQD